jgi:hypothetical protein
MWKRELPLFAPRTASMNSGRAIGLRTLQHRDQRYETHSSTDAAARSSAYAKSVPTRHIYPDVSMSDVLFVGVEFGVVCGYHHNPVSIRIDDWQ